MNVSYKKIAIAAAAVLAVTLTYSEDKFSSINRPAMVVKDVGEQVFLDGKLVGKNIVVVGERGLVVSTHDGKQWIQAAGVPTSVTLTAVNFVDDQNGWAVGHGGVVIKTQNGGKDWQKQIDGYELAKIAKKQADSLIATDSSSRKNQESLKNATLLESDGPDKPLLDVYFLDKERGWVIGAYGLAFQTVDGGKNWTSFIDKLENEKGLHLYSMSRYSDVILIAGEQGQIFKSIDLGKTYKKLKSPYSGTWFTIFAKNDKEIILGGLKGNLFISKDGGLSWRKINGVPPVSIAKINQDSKGVISIANQGGQLFSLVDFRLVKEIPMPQIPPLTNLISTKEGHRIALTLGGIVNLNGEMK